MGIGISILLIAIGAILTFGVEAAVQGLDLSSIGVILMIVGAIGIVVNLVVFGDRSGGRTYMRRTVAAPVEEISEVRRYDSSL